MAPPPANPTVSTAVPTAASVEKRQRRVSPRCLLTTPPPTTITPTTTTGAVLYMVAQCLGAICGVGIVKGIMKHPYNAQGGGANEVASGYLKGTTLSAEIIGTFVLLYTVFSATDPKRSARDSHVPVLAPLPIGFAVFMVHLATITITGTSINLARSFEAAVIYNQSKASDDH